MSPSYFSSAALNLSAVLASRMSVLSQLRSYGPMIDSMKRSTSSSVALIVPNLKLGGSMSRATTFGSSRP
jgi:hypothetical protein